MARRFKTMGRLIRSYNPSVPKRPSRSGAQTMFGGAPVVYASAGQIDKGESHIGGNHAPGSSVTEYGNVFRPINDIPTPNTDAS